MKKIYLLFSTLFLFSSANAQLPLGSATLGLTMQCTGGTSNRTGISFNPNQQLYYSVNAGNGSYPMETFDVSGTPVASVSAGFDYRGSWWNPNTSTLEGNGFSTLGIWIQDLDGSFYPLNSGTTDIGGVGGPNSQSSANYDSVDDEILYYDAGTIYRYTRATHSLVASVAVTGLPVATSNLNTNTIAYTGVSGLEAGLYDYVTKTFYFINKTSGAYVSSCTLPAGAPASATFKMGFANGYLWLYNTTSSQWEGYQTVTPCSGPPSTSSFSVTACDTYTVPSGDEIYTAVGNQIVMDTIQNTAGCDSIMTINLTVNASAAFTDVISACDSLVWQDGNTYYASNNIATDTLSTITGCDSVITLDLTLNNSSSFTDIQNECTFLVWIDGNTYTSSNNTASWVIPNTVNCDSVITLDLIINVDTTVAVNGITFTSNQPTGTYQWFNCATGVAISGATNASFTPTSLGSYAVAISNGGCTDTSACQTYSDVGLNAQENLQFSVHPNPSKGIFNLSIDEIDELISIHVINTLGQTVVNLTAVDSKFTEIDLSKIESGLYFLIISTADKKYNLQLIKE